MERKIALPLVVAILLTSMNSKAAMLLLNEDVSPSPPASVAVSPSSASREQASKAIDLPSPVVETAENDLPSSSASSDKQLTENKKKSTKKPVKSSKKIKSASRSEPANSFADSDISPDTIGAQILNVPSSFNLDPSRDASLREALVRWGVLAGGWRVVWEGSPKTFQMPADFGGEFRSAIDELKRATGLDVELYEGNQVIRVISR